MIKIYQDIHKDAENSIRGNCTQAVIASIFDLSLEEVPHFVQLDKWWEVYCEFHKKMGYKVKGYVGRDEFEEIEYMDGVNGFFHAAVYSPTHYRKEDKSPVRHAVVVDQYLNIIHDPNPDNKDVSEYPEESELGWGGVLRVYIAEKI